MTDRLLAGSQQNTRPTCRTCRSLHLHSDGTFPQDIRMDSYELVASADEGDCCLCSLIYRGLIQIGWELPPPKESGDVRIVAKSGMPWYLDVQGPSGRIAAEIYQTAGRGGGIDGLGHATDVAEGIDLGTILSRTKTWIQHCNNSHTCYSSNSGSAPFRLVDIGDPRQSKQSIRLVQNLRRTVKYVALSHCWGLTQAFTTTKSSLSARLKSISWNKLPKSYQDTITISRGLGLQYLWIDSLCILQDDVSDWEEESAKMSSIYENAYLTVSIALASNDEAGFLHPIEEKGKYTSFSVELDDFGIESETVKIRHIHDHRTLQTPHPLHTRAWTLQETLLSTRMLTFSVMITFECRQSNFCECGSGMSPDPFCADAGIFRRADRNAYVETLEKSQNAREIYQYWNHSVVVPYSRRKLSIQGDRLPALSALALKFEQRLEDRYLAGLWAQDLVLGMDWESGLYSQNAANRAPSWSWASIEGPVNFRSSRDYSDAWTVLEADVPSKRTSAVQLGRLHVTSLACWAWLQATWVGPGHHDAHGCCKYSLTRQGFEDHNQKIIRNSTKVDPALKLDTRISAVTATLADGESVVTVQRSNDDASKPRSAVSGLVLCVFLYELPVREWNRFRRRFLVLGVIPKRVRSFQRLGALTITRKDSAWLADMSYESVVIE